MARYVGRLVWKSVPETRILELLRYRNSMNNPPLEWDEVVSIYNSIKVTHERHSRAAP